MEVRSPPTKHNILPTMKLFTNHHLFKQIASLLDGDITYQNEIVDDPDANSGSKASDYDR